MAKFFFTNKAVDDLSAIWNYTYETWSENQADKYYEQLIESCRHLALRPTIGRRYDEIAGDILGFRVNKHVIFYRVTKPGEIEIIRILHGSMDLKNRMEE